MKILVTGANGYLGQGIVPRIIDEGHDVVATDINSNYIDARACIKQCNLFEVDNPYKYFGEPEALLHLAWRDGFIHYSNAHVEDLYKHYTFIRRILESRIQKIAVMGSVHEIGFFEGCVKDDTPCHPVTPYGISKNALRELTEMLAKKYDVNFIWLRGYYIVGNLTHGSSIFSKLNASAMEKKTEFPFTMGQNQFDFIDYDNFCDQVAFAVCQDEVNGIINICSGYPEKLADRVERFIRENGLEIKLSYGEFPDRPYDSKAIWGDATKIERIIATRNDRSLK